MMRIGLGFVFPMYTGTRTSAVAVNILLDGLSPITIVKVGSFCLGVRTFPSRNYLDMSTEEALTESVLIGEEISVDMAEYLIEWKMPIIGKLGVPGQF